jgi:hypothetical protein
MNVANSLIAVVVAVVLVRFIGYTKPGHQLLNQMGLVTAACANANC